MPRPLFPQERAADTRLIRSWMGPRAGLDDTKKWTFLTPPELELRPLVATLAALSDIKYVFRFSLTIFVTDICSYEKQEANDSRRSQCVGKFHYSCRISVFMKIPLAVLALFQVHDRRMEWM